jgi:hypothetical protein
MLKSVLLMFSFLLFSGPHAFADGGSSVAGMGAPKTEYNCYEAEYVFSRQKLAPDFPIFIGKLWPAYEREILFSDFQHFLEGAPENRQKATLHEPVAQGDPVVYTSTNYRVEIYVSEPSTVEEYGRVYWHAKFYFNDVFVHDLKCHAGEFAGHY